MSLFLEGFKQALKMMINPQVESSVIFKGAQFYC